MPKQLQDGKHSKQFCDGDELNYVNGAITKRAVTDKQLAAYFYETYYGIGNQHDSLGRTALHMAASCGRSELCEWLVNCAGANINCRDWESGYTPLQRALFHGHIRTAVRLIQMGADLTVLDREGLTAVDIVTKDRPKQVEIQSNVPSQVYIWGSNDNYTLGTGTNKSIKIPDLLDNFKRRNVSIAQVCMDEFHSVFISRCNRSVWVCGSGQGGRLGISSEKHVLTPALLLSNNDCSMAAIALSHTLILLSTGTVLACGQNEHYQLGITPYLKVSKTLKAVSIKNHEDLIGVCAAKYHSIFYTKRSLYVCGLNGGQLGLHADQNNVPFVKVPTQVPINLKSGSIITSVSTSPTCVAFSVSSGNIYILYQFQFKKIASKQLNVKEIATIGGSLQTDLINEGGSSLKVVLLTLGGTILIWQESVPQLTRCMFGLNKSISIASIFLNEKQLLFTTREGEAFAGTIGQIEKQTVNSSKEDKSGFHKFLEKSECYRVAIKRIPNVHRAVAITSDPKGKNFAVIQVHPQHALTKIPVQNQDRMALQFEQLLDESSEMDSLHDITFKVQNTLFPAHKYIIACADSLLLNSPLDDETVTIADVLPIIFKEILTYIYTGHCDLLKTGPVDSRFISSTEDPIKLLLNASNKYKISSLYKKVSCFKYESGCVILKDILVIPEFIAPKFNRESYPELYDVSVQSVDGKLLRAHKCVLAARLDYFHSMLMGGWSESISTPVLHVECPIKSLETLMDFLYTNEIPYAINTDSFEHLGRLLIISDQLLCSDLKEVCELSLINALTLKNAATMLQLSYIYNAPQLKKSVMQFISLNLDTIIENRALDSLSDELLLDLDNYIRSFNSVHYDKRIITPYSDYTLPDETILSSSPIVWPENMLEMRNNDQNEKVQKTITTPPKKKSTPSKKPIVPEAIPEGIPQTVVTKESFYDSKIEQVDSSPPYSEPVLNMLDFPSLDSKNTFSLSNHKTHHRTSPEVRKVFPPRLSQKERKRLNSLESEGKGTLQANENTPPKPQFKGWTILPQSENLPKEDDEKNLGLSAPKVSSFVEIIASEKEEKDNFFKMRAKSFMLTQLEDKAMEELYEFYNASNVFDEKITVHRVLPINIAKPTWIKSHKKNSH